MPARMLPARLPCRTEAVHAVFRYTNTSLNNLEYWGLDYPPLSAYQVGLVVHGCGLLLAAVSHYCPLPAAELAVWQGDWPL